jgi:tRNA dimethylallyltransferase
MTMPVELPEPEVIDVRSLLDSCLAGETEMICVLGPTASGKTKYAVALAREMNRLLAEMPDSPMPRRKHSPEGADFSLPERRGDPAARVEIISPEGADPSLPERRGDPAARVEIISADSRQVYVGMDIGSGKDLEEYGEIPVHLVDIAPAGSKYNVYRYQQDFARVYADIRSRGCIPLLCGGTGLYIEAAARGYDFGKDQPTVDPALLPSRTFFIGTLVSREVRNERIDARLRDRLEHGLVEEVRGLLDSGIPAEDLIYYGLEYKYVTQYVLGILSYEEMYTLLSNAIHQFAKRQMTWFRGMERDGLVIHWVEV